MSGNPYGNPGGYPPQYGGGYNQYPPDNSFQGAPPPQQPMGNYSDGQSCASLYGTPGPTMNNNNNYPPAPAPYDAYGGNQMSNAPYGMGAGNNYPPPPLPPSGGSMYNQPPQQYGGHYRSLVDCYLTYHLGYGNAPYPQQPGPPPPQPSGGMYPNYPPQPQPNYTVSSQNFSLSESVSECHLLLSSGARRNAIGLSTRSVSSTAARLLSPGSIVGSLRQFGTVPRNGVSLAEFQS